MHTIDAAIDDGAAAGHRHLPDDLERLYGIFLEQSGVAVGDDRLVKLEELGSLILGRPAPVNTEDELADGVDIEDNWSLLVDRVRARQIFVNLLGNSVKFTPKDGKIGIETRETADGKLALTVWDSGIGIPAEEQDHVFEHFYQVENNILSRRDQGTGLGLSGSIYLARLMGGDITLESETDNGARFTVALPLAKPFAPVPRKD